MPSDDELLSILNVGFSAENLREISKLAIKTPAFEKYPSALPLLSYISHEIADQWDGPVTVPEATATQQKFEEPIRQLLQAVAEDSRDTCFAKADELARLITT